MKSNVRSFQQVHCWRPQHLLTATASAATGTAAVRRRSAATELSAGRGRCCTGQSRSSGCAHRAAPAAGSVWMWHNRWSRRCPGPLRGAETDRQTDKHSVNQSHRQSVQRRVTSCCAAQQAEKKCTSKQPRVQVCN